jgi:hypothetical protein
MPSIPLPLAWPTYFSMLLRGHRDRPETSGPGAGLILAVRLMVLDVAGAAGEAERSPSQVLRVDGVSALAWRTGAVVPRYECPSTSVVRWRSRSEPHLPPAPPSDGGLDALHVPLQWPPAMCEARGRHRRRAGPRRGHGDAGCYAGDLRDGLTNPVRRVCFSPAAARRCACPRRTA